MFGLEVRYADSLCSQKNLSIHRDMGCVFFDVYEHKAKHFLNIFCCLNRKHMTDLSRPRVPPSHQQQSSGSHHGNYLDSIVRFPLDALVVFLSGIKSSAH